MRAADLVINIHNALAFMIFQTLFFEYYVVEHINHVITDKTTYFRDVMIALPMLDAQFLDQLSLIDVNSTEYYRTSRQYVNRQFIHQWIVPVIIFMSCILFVSVLLELYCKTFRCSDLFTLVTFFLSFVTELIIFFVLIVHTRTITDAEFFQYFMPEPVDLLVSLVAGR